MESKQWIQNISCRICRESTSCKSVTFELDSDWSSLFEFCFGFQITQNGPLSFCENCVSKLQEYGEFKQLCIQSEEIWKSLTYCLPGYTEENIEENTDYLDIFDHYDNDANFLLVIKEDEEENLVKKLEDKLTEISIKKIEKPLVKIEEPTDAIKTLKTSSKNSKHCKDEGKIDKKHKALKTSKNNSVESVKHADVYCGLCDFTSTSTKIKQHLLQHCQENMLNCQLCSFEGRDVAHMISHRYTHCPPKKNKLRCLKCSKYFQNGRTLQFHYRSVHLGKKGGLCIICGNAYKSYKRWKSHEAGHVSRNFICDHCGLGFVHRSHIISHMPTHYDVRKYICEICGKAFKRPRGLKDHNYRHHTVHEKETCPVCHRKCVSKINLARHIRREHGQMKFACEVCFKRFCTKRQFQQHMFYHHSDAKPYECNICGTKLRSKCSLVVHTRIHTGESYECNKCDERFVSITALKRHQSVHTGVRPIKCLFCTMTFYERKAMLMHCKSKHKELISCEELEALIVKKTEETRAKMCIATG